MEPELRIKSCVGLSETNERHELYVSTRRAVKTGREVSAPKTQDEPELGIMMKRHSLFLHLTSGKGR